MRILGIDPGSVITGVGVIDHLKGKLQLIEQGAIRCGKGEELPKRPQKIYDGVMAIIQRTSPTVVAVEAPFAGKNARSLIQLAHARGVVLLAARTAGLEVVEYSPRSVKSAVVGYGAAEKEQVGKMVRLLLPAIDQARLSADAADALAVAICHAHSAKMRILAR
jgi:crossover junction endodeoxyribonuclease RuvC